MAKREKSKRPNRPAPRPAARPVGSAAAAPEEIRGAVAAIQQVVQDAPEGWGAIAEVLKSDEADPEAILDFLARNMGKDVLPLLRGLSLEDDEELSSAAIRALPLLGTRAAGEVLVEASAAHPEGERARLVWQGVEALRARGINVTVPEPGGARTVAPQFQVREIWESISDGVGSRETIARVQDRYGVWHSLVLIWNDRAGIKDTMMGPLSQKEWRGMLEDHAREEIQVAELPLELARWQIDQVRLLNERSGFPLKDMTQWDTLIGRTSAGYAAPAPTAAVKELPPHELDHLQNHLGCLFGMPAFKTWGIEPADCKPWWDAWCELDEDKSEEEQIAEADVLLAKIANELITPETVALYRERLLDTAIKLRLLRHDHEADIAAAVALEMQDVKVPGDHKMFRYLAGNSLEMLSGILEDGEDPEKLRYDPMGTEELAQAA